MSGNKINGVDTKKEELEALFLYMGILEAYEAVGIPYTEMKPETLADSALVVNSIKTAILGPMETINQIRFIN